MRKQAVRVEGEDAEQLVLCRSQVHLPTIDRNAMRDLVNFDSASMDCGLIGVLSLGPAQRGAYARQELVRPKGLVT